MFWRKSTHCCKSKDCCTSVSSSSFKSRSESCLILGKTTDDDKDFSNRTTWQNSEREHPLYPLRSMNFFRKDLSLAPKESKHRVEIKIIDENRPRKIEEKKLIHVVQSKPHTSALKNLTDKTVSALSNYMSSIFTTTSTVKDINKTKNNKNIEDVAEIMNIENIEREEQKSESSIAGDANKSKTIIETKDVTEETNIEDNEEEDEQNDNYIKIETTSEGAPIDIEKDDDQYEDRVHTLYPPVDEIGADDEQEQINDLIQKFKSEALNVDDVLFEKLIERLKNELDLLCCVCPGANIILEDTSSKSLDVKKSILDGEKDVKNTEETSILHATDSDSKKDFYLSIKEMRDLFTELKFLLEKNIAESNAKSNDEKINEGIITICPGDIYGECDCRNKNSNDAKSSDNPKNDNIEKIDLNDKPNDFAYFYEKLTTRIDEIVCQCGKNDHVKDYDIKEKEYSSDNHQISSFRVDPMNYKDLDHITDSLHKTVDENRSEKVPKDKITLAYNTERNSGSRLEEEPLYVEKSEGLIALKQFIDIANELKEALYTSSCKCTKGLTEYSYFKEEETLGKITSSGRAQLSVTNEALQDSVETLKISEDFPPVQQTPLKIAEEPSQKSNFFEKIINLLPLPTFADSPTDSFYSAQCDVLQQQNWQQSNFVIGRRDEEVEVNTTCKCQIDQVVQTLEDMNISFGVFCDGQLPAEEQNLEENSDIQIRRRMSQEGDVEKILVRIRMKENNSDIQTAEMEQSDETIQSFADYAIKYETTQEYIDEPKVVKAGNRIKIFIPLGN